MSTLPVGILGLGFLRKFNTGEANERFYPYRGRILMRNHEVVDNDDVENIWTEIVLK